MIRWLSSPYRWFLRLIGDRASLPLRRLTWRMVRRIGKIGAAILPRRRKASRVELVLFVWDVDEKGLATAVNESAVEPGRLLVVTDCDRFSSLHRAGVAVEYVPPAQEVAQRVPSIDAGALLQRRVQEILDSYPHRGIAVAGAAPAELTRALRRLAADERELVST